MADVWVAYSLFLRNFNFILKVMEKIKGIK